MNNVSSKSRTEAAAVRDSTSRNPDSHRVWRSDALSVAVLILLASLPYVNILGNGFVYDDDTQLLQNPYVTNLRHLKQIFTTTVWAFQGGAAAISNYYRPVMTLTYALCHEMFGFEPSWFHVVSIALHAGVVCVLFFVTRRVFRDRPLAFLAAALFALHPIHTEAVDWVAAVTDLEATIFFLIAFWLFLSLDGAAGKRWGLFQAVMILSFAFALLSKESAAPLPLIAAVYEHTCREDRQQTSALRKLRRYGALWLLLFVYVIVRARVLGAFAPVASRPHAGFNTVVLSAIALTGQYVEKMVWPVHLCAAYVFPGNLGSLLPGILVGLAVAAVSILLTIYFWERERRVFFGLVWFFATLAPVLNVRWMPSFTFAERYLYLPSAGFCWVASWLVLRVVRWPGRARIPRRLAMAGAGCALAALMAARIVTRNRDWKNDLTFYTRTLEASPKALTIRNDLGNYYWAQGNLPAAQRQWEKAYRLDPTATYVLDNLGLLRVKQERYREAVLFFDRSLAVTANDEGAHAGLGEAYGKMGMRQRAEKELSAAIKLAPLDGRPKVRLGEIYFDEGKYASSLSQFQASIHVLPTPRAYYGLGLSKWMQKDLGGAENAFKSACRLAPSTARPYFMLGLFYGATGRFGEAIREYQAGLRFDPGNKAALAALARLRRQLSSAHPQ